MDKSGYQVTAREDSRLSMIVVFEIDRLLDWKWKSKAKILD